MCDDDVKTLIVSDYLPYQYQKLANILLSLNILVFCLCDFVHSLELVFPQFQSAALNWPLKCLRKLAICYHVNFDVWRVGLGRGNKSDETYCNGQLICNRL